MKSSYRLPDRCNKLVFQWKPHLRFARFSRLRIRGRPETAGDGVSQTACAVRTQSQFLLFYRIVIIIIGKMDQEKLVTRTRKRTQSKGILLCNKSFVPLCERLFRDICIRHAASRPISAGRTQRLRYNVRTVTLQITSDLRRHAFHRRVTHDRRGKPVKTTTCCHSVMTSLPRPAIRPNSRFLRRPPDPHTKWELSRLCNTILYVAR